ncbi:hypothetical protein HJC10_43395, partial [Corallococcus exiguus]|nr:hypothetical protein [Corallococcus exiguus]
MTIVSPEASLDPDQGETGDVTHFWRVPRHNGLDCLRATFRRHAYARHSHDTYAIAGITAGCETFYHRGEQHYAGAGSIAVVCPDEVHDGKPYGDGFAYRTIYPSADLMREVAEEVTGRSMTRPPWFPGSVVWDPLLIAALTSLHASLHASSVTDRPWVSEMEQDSRLVDFLARFIARFADCDRTEADPGGHHGIVRARDYIEVHLG